MRKKPPDPDSLRAKAEAQLCSTPATDAPARPADELLHELQVYRLELEMQNEELRRANTALEKSHQRYVNLYDFAPVGYLQLSADGLITEINLTAAKLLGVDRCQLLNRHFTSLIASQDSDFWYLFCLNLKKHQTPQNTALQLKRSDQTTLLVHLDCLYITLAGQDPVLHITLTDISEMSALKALERQLQEVHQFNRQIIDSASVGIIVYDTLHRFLDWNPAMEAMTGLSKAACLNKHAADVFPFLLESPNWQGFQRALQGETVRHPAIAFKVPETGKSGWATSTQSPLLSSGGEIVGVIETVADVTDIKEVKRNAAQFRDSEAYMRAIFNATPDAMLISDEQGIITMANRQAEHLLGYSLDELLGQSLELLVPERFRAAHPALRAQFSALGVPRDMRKAGGQ